MNLVGNAVKFTDEGNVKITVKTTSGNQLEVTVSDTGMGIREKDQVNLFKAFQQIDMSSTKKHEGTGLGLYLCKKLMDLLDGDISAASQYGKGSRFSFRLPLNPKIQKGDLE
jgi:signal transduction histidine kinase